MASSLFQNQVRSQKTNNPIQMITEFKKFLSTGITPEKAKQTLMEKIKSGEISQQQFEILKAQAQQMQEMINFFNWD